MIDDLRELQERLREAEQVLRSLGLHDPGYRSARATVSRLSIQIEALKLRIERETET